MLNYPPHIIEEYKKHVSEGVFASRSIGTWRGGLTYTIPSDELGMSGVASISFSPKVKATKYQTDLRLLMFEVKRIFRFYSAKVNLGYFVPAMNEEKFRKQIEEDTKTFFKFRDETLANYDTIINEIRLRYAELSFWVWKNQFHNDGDPPGTFVKKFTDNAINRRHSPEAIERRFKFDVVYVRPSMSLEDQEKVAKALYKRIIGKRKGLVYYMLKKKGQFLASKNRGPRQKMCKFLFLWSNIIFFNDPELIRLIENIRETSLLSLTSTCNDIAVEINNLIRYMVDSKDYPLGLTL